MHFPLLQWNSKKRMRPIKFSSVFCLQKLFQYILQFYMFFFFPFSSFTFALAFCIFEFKWESKGGEKKINKKRLAQRRKKHKTKGGRKRKRICGVQINRAIILDLRKS